MVRTTQEGAASLKIMKIPLQSGAAQQAEAVLGLHRSLWRLASHLAAVVAECRQRAIKINSYSFSIWKKKKNSQ